MELKSDIVQINKEPSNGFGGSFFLGGAAAAGRRRRRLGWLVHEKLTRTKRTAKRLMAMALYNAWGYFLIKSRFQRVLYVGILIVLYALCAQFRKSLLQDIKLFHQCGPNSAGPLFFCVNI